MASRLTILFTVLIGFLVASIDAAPALAQGKGDKQNVKEAQEHFKRATAHRELEEYAAAAVEYLAAYELHPDPEFFFLAGEVYQLNGDKRLALEHFSKYVADDPNGRAVDAAKKFIASLTEEIEREDAANRPVDPPPGDDDDDDGGIGDDDDDGSKGDDDDDGFVAPADDDDDDKIVGTVGGGSPGRGKKIGGIVMLGVGAVAIGLGGVFGKKAADISNEITDITGEWTSDDTDRFNEGEAAERNMFILYGVGAASVIAGGVLYYLGATAKPARAEPGSVSFGPTITGSSVGFAASGWF